MSLCVCRSTGSWISIDLVEQGSVVGKIERTRERVEGTRRTVEIIVVEFLAIFAAKLECMISVDFTHDVAELERLFRKDAGRGFGLVGAEPNSVAVTQQVFKFNSR